ncbi:hypothetical protein H9P43_002872 [Blastocladiella emersonii ATCC 22665]|nr:hypothetical protein H9P43_002872 [Blastocladiella emersonii ATCC 22665]
MDQAYQHQQQQHPQQHATYGRAAGYGQPSPQQYAQPPPPQVFQQQPQTYPRQGYPQQAPQQQQMYHPQYHQQQQHMYQPQQQQYYAPNGQPLEYELPPSATPNMHPQHLPYGAAPSPHIQYAQPAPVGYVSPAMQAQPMYYAADQQMGTPTSLAVGPIASPASAAQAAAAPPLAEALRIDTSLPLDQLREDVRMSLDPLAHLQFVRYLVTLADEVAATEPDPRVAQKQMQLLHGEALKWVKRLASHGPGGLNGARTAPCPDASVYLAECYGNGMLGLPLDHDKAFSLYLQASKAGHPAATYRVAVCYEVGAGTKRDNGRAVQFFKKAAALGDPAALYKLGLILMHGDLGHQANPREGLVMLKRAAAAADADNPHAVHELALLHEPLSASHPSPPSKEIAHIVIPDPAYSLELYTQSAQLGYAPSQFRLGTCFQDGDLGCPVDAKASIMWYTRAAEQGHPDAELALSGWYLEGADGVLPPNDEQAYAWARRAADKGLSKAEFAVAYYHEMGVGVPQSLEEARRWYQRAAAQGNRKAMDRLQDMRNFARNAGNAAPAKRDKGDCTIM